MSNNFWQEKQENKLPWGEEKAAPATAPPASTLPDDKPWPQAEPEQQSANELLALASTAEIEANKASEAARAAIQAAQAANSALETRFDPQDVRIHKAKEEAAQQAVLASQAALSAQQSARDSAAGAVSQAEAEVEKALLMFKNSEKEFSALESSYRTAADSAEEASETAAAARQKAEQEIVRYQANEAAFLAARILKEQAAAAYDSAQQELHNAKQLAQDANLRLADLQQQHLQTREETRQIIAELEEQTPPPETERPWPEAAPIPSTERSWLPEVTAQAAASTALAPANDFYAEPEPEPAEPPRLKHAAHAAEEEEDTRSTGRKVASVIILIAIAVAIAFSLRTFVFEITIVNGYSMLPTLQDNDRLFTGKINYLLGDPQRGDIVVIDAPDKEDEYYIKRVIGLPNDRLTIKEGKVYINDKLYDEPYLNQLYTVGDIDLIIAENTYFVMGDNRDESHDSRDSSVGTIAKEHIRGKALVRLFPFNNIGSLYN